MQSGHAGDWVFTLIPTTGLFAVLAILSIAHYAIRLLRRQQIGTGIKIVKLFAVILLWTLVGTLALACDLSRGLDSEAELAVSASPDGAHRLTVTSTSPLTFGSHGITIYLGRQGGIEHQIASTRLANDGKTLYAGGNCQVTWTGDDRAEVWLAGEEQEPETITVEIQGDQALVQTGSSIETMALSGAQSWLEAIFEHLPVILLGLVPFVLLLAWNLWLWRSRGS